MALVHQDEPHEHCDRASEIAGEVQRVRCQRRTSVTTRCAPQDDGATDVDNDHDPDHGERVPPRLDRRRPLADEMRGCTPGDEEAGRGEDRSLGKSREMLRLAVPVLVRDVSGPDRDANRKESQQRRHEVGAGVQRLRDETEAVRRETRAELERDERNRRGHGDERGPSLRVHPASETEEPAGKAGSSLLSYPLKLRAGDVAVEVLDERRPGALAAVLPVADDELPVSAAGRRGVVVVELAVRAVRRSVAREHCSGAEERLEEVTREARSDRARRLPVEDAAHDRALEIATETTRHIRANHLAMLALVRGAVARTLAGDGREYALVDTAKPEGAVAVGVHLIRPRLRQRRPRLGQVAATVGRGERKAELVLALRLPLALVARIGETGRSERQNPDEQDERNDHAPHLFPPLLAGFAACGVDAAELRGLWFARVLVFGLEIAAEGLLALDRFEQGLEVPLAEAPCAVALDHLEEERRAILRGLREDLEEVAVLVAVGEDAQPAEVVPVLADLADALADVLVIRVGRRQKDDSLVLERL